MSSSQLQQTKARHHQLAALAALVSVDKATARAVIRSTSLQVSELKHPVRCIMQTTAEQSVSACREWLSDLAGLSAMYLSTKHARFAMAAPWQISEPGHRQGKRLPTASTLLSLLPRFFPPAGYSCGGCDTVRSCAKPQQLHILQ